MLPKKTLKGDDCSLIFKRSSLKLNLDQLRVPLSRKVASHLHAGRETNTLGSWLNSALAPSCREQLQRPRAGWGGGGGANALRAVLWFERHVQPSAVKRKVLLGTALQGAACPFSSKMKLALAGS